MTRGFKTPRMLAMGAALAGGLLLNAPAHAQDHQQHDGPRQEQGARQDPGQRLDRQVARLTERLQLSTAQAGQVRRILAREQEQLQAFRQKNGGAARPQPGQRPDGARGQELRAVRERTEQQIERVLNDRQRAEYARLRQERQERGGDRRGGREGGEDRRGGETRARS
jgi:Spy/CpxP family protein refolding chaperone